MICNLEGYNDICIRAKTQFNPGLTFIAVVMEILIKACSRCHKDHHIGMKGDNIHAIRDMLRLKNMLFNDLGKKVLMFLETFTG